MSSPPMTSRMVDALRSGAPICLLAMIDHPEGMQRFWTGVGPLEYDGQTWIGLGVLGSVSPVKYTAELVIQELQFSLSGVPSDMVSWLESDVRNRPADVWLAVLDQYGQIVPNPYAIITALLDYQNLQVDDQGNAAITLIARSGFYTLERALDEVHSPEDQKRTYASDTGLDLIYDIRRQEVIWRPA